MYKAYNVCHSVVIHGVGSHLACLFNSYNYTFYDETLMSGAMLIYTMERYV
jgi:hypothetical protein